jgi:hypothetical protein
MTTLRSGLKAFPRPQTLRWPNGLNPQNTIKYSSGLNRSAALTLEPMKYFKATSVIKKTPRSPALKLLLKDSSKLIRKFGGALTRVVI